MGSVQISERLKCLCNMVTQGRRVVDVGCDHGFVSIYLVQQGICPGALAMDVRSGPLSRAKEHVAEYELTEYIETRLSDGLLAYQAGEAQSLICAGMGGRLMEKILTESREKAKSLEELILQPQSELREFRTFLKREGYKLLDEHILCEEGKYYFLMKVCPSKEVPVNVSEEAAEKVKNGLAYDNVIVGESSEELGLRYGELLLERKNSVLKEFLQENLQNMQQIEQNLMKNENERARCRLEEIRSEINYLKQALSLYD